MDLPGPPKKILLLGDRKAFVILNLLAVFCFLGLTPIYPTNLPRVYSAIKNRLFSDRLHYFQVSPLVLLLFVPVFFGLCVYLGFFSHHLMTKPNLLCEDVVARLPIPLLLAGLIYLVNLLGVSQGDGNAGLSFALFGTCALILYSTTLRLAKKSDWAVALWAQLPIELLASVVYLQALICLSASRPASSDPLVFLFLMVVPLFASLVKVLWATPLSLAVFSGILLVAQPSSHHQHPALRDRQPIFVLLLICLSVFIVSATRLFRKFRYAQCA